MVRCGNMKVDPHVVMLDSMQTHLHGWDMEVTCNMTGCQYNCSGTARARALPGPRYEGHPIDTWQTPMLARSES